MSFILCLLFLAFISSVSSECVLTRRYSNCNYTVFCELTAASVSNPSCENDPYVTFVITKSRLTYLTTGYFSSTNFDSRVREIIAKETDSLTTLLDLDVSSNDLRDINLSYFKELMSANLGNNKLTNVNMTSFRNNEYLQSLDVSRNNITDLPPGTFLLMKNLKLLNVSSNYLTKLRFGSLKGLHKTEVLDLSKNYISVLDVDVFHDCDDLKTLIIDYNRIKTLDVERLILIHVRKLRTLSLGGNPIACKEIVHNIKAINVSSYTVREVEVTAVDKIYHEDNVHGIKCGDDGIDDRNNASDAKARNSTGISPPPVLPPLSSTAVLVW
ncbi:hypothetical protein SFRURICE_012034 [Spodoptera frugiperda]|nr:hypothetical protein SFRURICE_012034 [Spodoptera frugiperda]